jgi:alpha-tubulin suppressor-like RCC1 family protein
MVGFQVKKVACGDYHTLALLEDGTVHSWGGTLHKKLGQKKDIHYPYKSPTPYLIESLARKAFMTDIAWGDFHSLALDDEGRLYSWGGGGASYNKGQCGHGDEKDAEHPKQIEYFDGIRIIKLTAGGFHTLVCTENHDVFAWGQGVYGECGYGEFYNVSTPHRVKMPKEGPKVGVSKLGSSKSHNESDYQENIMIKHISAGAHHSLILTEDGQLYSFGYGQNGQLGLRNNSNYCTPQLVRDFLTQPLTTIEAGWHHSLALTQRGDLYTWGYGEFGQLGLGSVESKTHFTLVESIGDKNIDKIYAGGNHSWVCLNDIDPVRSNYRYPDALNDKSPEQIKQTGFNMSHDEEDKIEDLLVATSEFSQNKGRRDTIDLLPGGNTLTRK